MGKIRITIWVLILAIGELAFAADAVATTCVASATNSCPVAPKPVSEVPAGEVDGHNTTFTLSSQPLAGTPVRVFDNGIEQHDDQVTGRTLVFSSTHVPSPGDVLNVFYFVQGTGDASQPQQTTQVSAGDQDISAQLLQNAMNREMGHVLGVGPLEAGSPAIIPASQNGDRSAHPSQESYRLASIDMLERQLKAVRSVHNRVTSKKSSRRLSADGVEGLGDNYVSSPFDTLSSTAAPELDQLLQASPTTGRSTSAGTPPATVPVSIRMLVDRLSRSEGQ